MASGAAAAPSAGAGGGGGGAGNPFQLATNLYAEKNNQGILAGFTTSATGQSSPTAARSTPASTCGG